MNTGFYIEEYLNTIETRIKKCEEVIGIREGLNEKKGDKGKFEKNEQSSENASVLAQNRLKIGQNSLMTNIENDIQLFEKVKDDENTSINDKLDIIEGIIKKIYSLGPLEDWLSNYETIKAYLEMDSADFESSVLTLDARKAYVKEHYKEFKEMREQLKELSDLLPYVNEELDISNINEIRKKLGELEFRGRKIGYETNSMWEKLEKLSFKYSNFIYKYNSLFMK
ncbi:hypothetical protein FG386_000549 [Cryptosporidium ryanae]|uniref:uncharacterized protein n=1 Tax=Cryptosporidium ryanae TaxID=515981 RepID=UPI00351A184F|nr:hypothetical protein FG386_000549 [Cryptosporidium ryanae]